MTLAGNLEIINHQGSTGLNAKCLFDAAFLVLTTLGEYGIIQEGIEQCEWRYKHLTQEEKRVITTSEKRHLRRNMRKLMKFYGEGDNKYIVKLAALGCCEGQRDN